MICTLCLTRSSFQFNQAPYDIPNMHAKPGTPCNDYNGYCDVFRKCREVRYLFILNFHYPDFPEIMYVFLFCIFQKNQVDPSGPIATLRKLLLSEENIASFKKWALDRWYYCALIFLCFFLLMVSTRLLIFGFISSLSNIFASPLTISELCIYNQRISIISLRMG